MLVLQEAYVLEWDGMIVKGMIGKFYQWDQMAGQKERQGKTQSILKDVVMKRINEPKELAAQGSISDQESVTDWMDNISQLVNLVNCLFIFNYFWCLFQQDIKWFGRGCLTAKKAKGTVSFAITRRWCW